jgi:cellulose synthase/poly-beta-1,6-N-acetylglucosamine synthase-like glycosyltransferase
LNALLNQDTNLIRIDEIFVISSGSTDQTDTIAEEFTDKGIILIKQEKREGKASAVNEFLKVSRNDILVLESADTYPEKTAIERLCLQFEDESIGMAGAHIIPKNDKQTFMGYVVHLLWNLHHQIALKSPKCGEMVAFRKIIDNIPIDTAVDEGWIEYKITKTNHRVVYSPEAIVYNKGPETINDFLKQRRRISCGHIDLYKRTKYKVSSWSLSLLISIIPKNFPLYSIKKWPWFFTAFMLEGIVRILGYYDYYIKKGRHSIWEIAETTKDITR